MTKSNYPAFITYVAKGSSKTIPDPGPKDSLGFRSGRVVTRGDVVELTPAFIEATRDRDGATWLDRLDGDARWVSGTPEDNAALLSALTLEAAAEKEDRRIEQVRLAHQYGGK